MNKTLAICLLLTASATQAFFVENNSGTKNCTAVVKLQYKKGERPLNLVLELAPETSREMVATQGKGDYTLQNIHAQWQGDGAKKSKEFSRDLTPQEFEQLNAGTHNLSIGVQELPGKISAPSIEVKPIATAAKK